MTPETRRQLIHLSVGLFAIPVPFLGPRWAVLLAGLAVFSNWVVFPLTGKDKLLMRDGEKFLNGIRYYPVAVLAAMILLPLTLAEATWAILAVGDAFSNIVGRRFGLAKLPWNRQKSWAGTLGFLLTAFPAAAAFAFFTERFAANEAFLARWIDSGVVAQLSPATILAATFLGSLVAAIIESLPIPLDDNLTVTASGGAAMAAIVCAVGSMNP